MIRFLVDLYRAVIGVVFVVGMLASVAIAITQPDMTGFMIALGGAAGLIVALGLSAAVIRIGDEVEALRVETAKASGSGAQMNSGEMVKMFKGEAITRQGKAFHVGNARFGTVLDAEAWITARQSARP